MKRIWIDEEGDWIEAHAGFIVEVSDGEIEELHEQPKYWHHEFLGGRKALAFRDGKMIETTMPKYEK